MENERDTSWVWKDEKWRSSKDSVLSAELLRDRNFLEKLAVCKWSLSTLKDETSCFCKKSPRDFHVSKTFNHVG